jgi:hypothetical protein
VFFAENIFQSSLIFAGRVGAFSSGAPFQSLSFHHLKFVSFNQVEKTESSKYIFRGATTFNKITFRRAAL